VTSHSRLKNTKGVDFKHPRLPRILLVGLVVEEDSSSRVHIETASVDHWDGIDQTTIGTSSDLLAVVTDKRWAQGIVSTARERVDGNVVG